MSEKTVKTDKQQTAGATAVEADTITEEHPNWPPALVAAMGPQLAEDETGTSLWKGAFQRLRRNPSAIAGALMATAAIMTAPLMIGFLLAQRHFIRGITMTGVK